MKIRDIENKVRKTDELQLLVSKMITKEEVQKIYNNYVAAKKDFKNRCSTVIEALVGEDIEYTDIEKLKTDIYEIAHIGLQTCGNEHTDWVNNMEKLFKALKKGGLI